MRNNRYFNCKYLRNKGWVSAEKKMRLIGFNDIKSLKESMIANASDIEVKSENNKVESSIVSANRVKVVNVKIEENSQESSASEVSLDEALTKWAPLTPSPVSSTTLGEDSESGLGSLNSIQRDIRKILDCQSLILNNIEYLKQSLHKLQKMTSEIPSTSLQKQVTPLHEELQKLPLADLKEFSSLEDKLKDDSPLQTSIINYLSPKGATALKETVYHMLPVLFTNSCSKLINWTGANGKTAFRGSALLKVLLYAVRKNPHSSTYLEVEIERHIKRWFQLAADREGGRQARRDRQLNKININ